MRLSHFISAAQQLFRPFLFGGLIVLSCTSTAHADIASTPTELGTLGGGWSLATSVTNNGEVTGQSVLSNNTTSHAFFWTQSGGMTDLGTLGTGNSLGYAISTDGSTVVGSSNYSGGVGTHAFRWTQAGGMVDLGTFGGVESQAYGVSSDGSVITGYASTAGEAAYHAFRWTQAGGMVDLGTLGGTNSYAEGISGDGGVVAGSSDITGDAAMHAYRWTQAGGMVDLGTLGGTNSYAEGISGDGGTVIGHSQTTGNAETHAMLWTQAAGMADLGTLGGNFSESLGVNSDGSIVVGMSKITGNAITHAFRWTQAGGLQDFNTLLSDAGIDMTGIVLKYARGISPNGKYIVGEGSFPGYSTEAFLACYDLENNCVGLTTNAAQEASAQQLAANQQTSQIQRRSLSNALLGATRAITPKNYTFAGGQFGSAHGLWGGQYTHSGITLLGGFAYGTQDTPNVDQKPSPTIALGLRYTLKDFGKFHPYAEAGGWVTPNEKLTLTRSYMNGADAATGIGDTKALEWSGYGKLGLAYDLTEADQLNAWADVGRQYMYFDGYSETTGASNPFPAVVDAGTSRMNVVRGGLGYNHGFSKSFNFGISAAVAHSFDPKTNMNLAVSGVGTMTPTAKSYTWGEFGYLADIGLTEQLSLNLFGSVTAGGNDIGVTPHGGAGFSYKF